VPEGLEARLDAGAELDLDRQRGPAAATAACCSPVRM
jgi:hypothetical protein